MRRTSKLLLASLGLLALVTAALPARAVLLVDRGLPIGNLNDTVANFTAGSSRANVAWTDGGFTPSLYVLEGDTFKNTSSQTWSINQITLWTVGSTTTAALWGGIDGSTIGVVSSTYSMKDAFYASPPPDDLYLGNSGAYISMHQIDFAVNILLAPGQTYDFFLDGTGGAYTVPFVHASNAALSGSPQDGADNWMLRSEERRVGKE